MFRKTYFSKKKRTKDRQLRNLKQALRKRQIIRLHRDTSATKRRAGCGVRYQKRESLIPSNVATYFIHSFVYTLLIPFNILFRHKFQYPAITIPFNPLNPNYPPLYILHFSFDCYYYFNCLNIYLLFCWNIRIIYLDRKWLLLQLQILHFPSNPEVLFPFPFILFSSLFFFNFFLISFVCCTPCI